MPASESVCGGLKIFVTSSHEKVTVRVTRAVMPGPRRRRRRRPCLARLSDGSHWYLGNRGTTIRATA